MSWNLNVEMHDAPHQLSCISVYKPLADPLVTYFINGYIYIYISPGFSVLTPWGRVVHVFISELGHHWIRQWLVTWSAPSHYLNECWHNVNCTLRNISEWNFIWNSKVFIPGNVFENVVSKMSSIMSRSQCFNKLAARDALHQCLFNSSWSGTNFYFNPSMDK